MTLTLVRREVHARHFSYGPALFSRADSGEWFLSAFSVGAWSQLQPEETAKMEALFLE